MVNQTKAWIRLHHSQLRLGVRITVASLSAYLLCTVFGLSPKYPAVLTAVIVMQSSIGASLKAMVDRFLGSLGGAVWGVAVLLVLHRFNNLSPGIILALALTPLALFVAFKPAYRAALTAAIILLLTPSSGAGPLEPAIQRMIGIGIGSIVAIVVALVVLPARAHGALAEAAGRAVARMSELAAIQLKGIPAAGETERIQRLFDEIRKAIAQAEAVADEAIREQATYLASGPDPLPICRTLRRLRNDLSMIGRTISQPLPEQVQNFLLEPSAETASAVSTFLQSMSTAIAQQNHAPPIGPVEESLARYAAAVTELRRATVLRELSDVIVERVFGFAFGLEQLHQNLKDLIDRTNELAQPRA